eukprot:599654-Prymnesium_polylepis.1
MLFGLSPTGGRRHHEPTLCSRPRRVGGASGLEVPRARAPDGLCQPSCSRCAGRTGCLGERLSCLFRSAGGDAIHSADGHSGSRRTDASGAFRRLRCSSII